MVSQHSSYEHYALCRSQPYAHVAVRSPGDDACTNKPHPTFRMPSHQRHSCAAMEKCPITSNRCFEGVDIPRSPPHRITKVPVPPSLIHPALSNIVLSPNRLPDFHTLSPFRATCPQAAPKQKMRAKAAANQDDFNFKFGFSFQSPAKTIRCVPPSLQNSKDKAYF